MTLPFENNKNIRKYTCFCCGMMYENFHEYKSHIIENHEAGREYVSCPACQTPVRDIRSHYKVYHKNLAVPKQGQMKALIWKDQRNPSKRSKKVSFKEGYFTSLKNNGKQMHYNSSWEETTYSCLEVMSEVVSYEVEPFSIKYLDRGKVREYWPDLIVSYNDGHVEIWEIKPQNQTSLEVNKAKWDACKEYCSHRGWKFEVITEKEISKIYKFLKGKGLL